MIINKDAPTTYEEARRMGVYRDWYASLLTVIEDKERDIVTNLSKQGLPDENISAITSSSEEDYKLKKTDYWTKICNAIDDKNSYLPDCFRSIIKERMREIISNMLIKRNELDLTTDNICKATGYSKGFVEEIEYLHKISIKLLKKGISIADISEITELPIEQIEQLNQNTNI